MIKGDVVSDTAEFVEVETIYGKVKLDRVNVQSIEHEMYSIELKDGTIIKSELLEKTENHIKVKLYGNEITIPLAKVASMQEETTDVLQTPQDEYSQQQRFEPQTQTSAFQTPAVLGGAGALTSSIGAGDGFSIGQTVPKVGQKVAPNSASMLFAQAGSNLPTNSTIPIQPTNYPTPGINTNPNSISGLGALPSATSTTAVNTQDIGIVDLTSDNLQTQASTGSDFSQMQYLLTLKNGRQIKGSLLDINDESVRILTDEGEKSLLRSGILSIIVQQSSLSTSVQQDYKPTHVITLVKSGTKIQCAIIEETIDKVKYVTEYGMTEMSKSLIAKIEKIEEAETAEKNNEQEKEEEKKPEEPRLIKTKQTKWVKEFSVLVGIWKSPLKLDLTSVGGPEDVSLEGSAVTYGLRYMFYRFKKFHVGATGALQSIPNKNVDLGVGQTAKISGEAGYLELSAYFGTNFAATDGVYFIAGAGMSMTKITCHKYEDDSIIDSTTFSQTQPIISFGAGINKEISSTLLGLEARWSYVKQKEEALSKSSSGFLSIIGKISWRF